MPTLTMRSFKPAAGTPTGRPITVFRWDDEPAEDADFAAAMEYPGYVNNVAVDRSGATPILRWENWDGAPKSAVLEPIGSHWFSYSSGYADVLDVTGYWECDSYGRPYDLNDLLA